MSVSGPNIPAGTTVQSMTATTVTLNGPVAGDVPAGSEITFLMAATYLSDLVPVTASTTVDTPSGTTLTFVSTSKILAGMSVFGTGIGPGTTVTSVSATTVTLSKAVAADVPNKSVISFVTLASSLGGSNRRMAADHHDASDGAANRRDPEAGHGGAMDQLFQLHRKCKLAASLHSAGRARSLARTDDAKGRLCGHAHPRLHSRRAAILQRLFGRHGRAIACDRRTPAARSARAVE